MELIVLPIHARFDCTQQSGFCTDCFDEVCARCSTAIIGVATSDTEETFDVTVDGMPVCELQPSGSIASSTGTTLATLHREDGYYRTSNRSSVFHQCYRKDACIGSNSTANPCAPGYEGPCECQRQKQLVSRGNASHRCFVGKSADLLVALPTLWSSTTSY